MRKNHIILSVALALSAVIPVCRAASTCASADTVTPSGLPAGSMASTRALIGIFGSIDTATLMESAN